MSYRTLQDDHLTLVYAKETLELLIRKSLVDGVTGPVCLVFEAMEKVAYNMELALDQERAAKHAAADAKAEAAE